MYYILFACFIKINTATGGPGCVSAQFPDLNQCQNAGKVFERKMNNELGFSESYFYCQEVKNGKM